MPSQLSGKTIVIIGGTSGFGLSASAACIESGARVIAVGRNDENLAPAARELGDSAQVLAADACDPKTIDLAIERAISEFGGFDGLYHVAGGSGRLFGDGPLHEISSHAWTETLKLNLDSVFLSNRAAVKQFMKQESSGSILNMSSVLAFRPSPGFFATHAYAAAKSAIIGFSKSTAAYYAMHNIRVNVVAPALAETPMSARALNNPGIVEFAKSKQRLDGGRVGRPEDLDAAVVYLLSDESRFVTGQVLAIDGGWSVSS